MNNLQDILIEKRKGLKLSLRKAAEKIGVSHSYLSTLEKGRDPRSNSPVSPTPETLKLISKAYDIDYNLLMELAGYLKTFNEFNITITEDDDFQRIYKLILNHLVESVSQHYRSESEEDIQSKEFLESLKNNWESLNECNKIGLVESAIEEAQYNKYDNTVSLITKFKDEDFQIISDMLKKDISRIREQFSQKPKIVEQSKQEYTQSKISDPLIEQIRDLSPESIEELEKYMELLKIKDQVDKAKDETSSASQKEA